MINTEDVVKHFIDIGVKIAQIKDPDEQRSTVIRELNRYSLSEWCEVGRILQDANLI